MDGQTVQEAVPGKADAGAAVASVGTCVCIFPNTSSCASEGRALWGDGAFRRHPEELKPVVEVGNSHDDPYRGGGEGNPKRLEEAASLAFSNRFEFLDLSFIKTSYTRNINDLAPSSIGNAPVRF